MKRLVKAFYYSISGLRFAWKEEVAFRQELIAFVLLVPLAIYISEGPVERVLLILSLFIVLMAELANSAVEAVVDRISEEIHPLSKAAKDIGSAMVLVAIIQLLTVWGIIIIG